jgi:hypothetical protein
LKESSLLILSFKKVSKICLRGSGGSIQHQHRQPTCVVHQEQIATKLDVGGFEINSRVATALYNIKTITSVYPVIACICTKEFSVGYV